MAKFLVGWELGSERGHIALLEPIVEALRGRGHEVAVAVKDLGALSGSRNGLRNGRVFQAPVWPTSGPTSGPTPGPQPPGPTSQTLGDDLAAAGLCAEEAVQLRARAWVDLIDLLGVDAVLAEAAPTLLLAARTRCPAIAFGTAYGLPPAGQALPPILDLRRPPTEASAAREAALCRAFDSADRSLGGKGLRWFSDLFAVPAWVCNLKELDPYASLRSVAAPGPLQIRHADAATPGGRQPAALGEKVFVYLKPSPVLPTLMDALAPRCRQLEVFIANAPADLHNPFPQVTLHRAPIDVPRRLHEFSAVVHFGGLNLTAEALFAGVPQLILPHHLEQSATGLAVQQLGVGHCRLNIPLEHDREAERLARIADLVKEFFADASLPDRAAEFGAALRARQKPSLQGLVSLCEEVVARGGDRQRSLN